MSCFFSRHCCFHRQPRVRHCLMRVSPSRCPTGGGGGVALTTGGVTAVADVCQLSVPDFSRFGRLCALHPKHACVDDGRDLETVFRGAGGESGGADSGASSGEKASCSRKLLCFFVICSMPVTFHPSAAGARDLSSRHPHITYPGGGSVDLAYVNLFI